VSRGRPPGLAALAALLFAACAPALRPGGTAPSAAGPGDAGALAAEARALVDQVEREPDPARRKALATEAVAAGQRCDQAAPGAPACDYALGLALGVQARERPSTVRDGLAEMARRLRRAAATEPGLDRAGPHRVLALLLLRAPGWPLGPGDPEEGLAEARKAVALAPDHAPNQLALAEALLASERPEEGRAAARRAAALAEAAAAAGEKDAAAWLRDARTLSHAP
jgi:hypothetical protein